MNRRTFLSAGLRAALFGAAMATGLARVELPKVRQQALEGWTVNQTGGYYMDPAVAEELRAAMTHRLLTG